MAEFFSFFALWWQLICWVFQCLWSMYKWLLHRVTGLCELQRICYKEKDGAPRTLRIEASLNHSKVLLLRELTNQDHLSEEESVEKVMKAKGIKKDIYPEFGPTFGICLHQIFGYKQLTTTVETMRRTPFDADNEEHESFLIKFWQDLVPDKPLTKRISRDWTHIGFQGEDPKTDFRGMGMLGLYNLLYLTSEFTDTARRLLQRSHHPRFGYSFAIVGINITSLAYHLLCDGHLKVHFYNVVKGRPSLHHFHLVYCYLLYNFDKFWFDSEPRDIMEFNQVREQFRQLIIERLKGEDAQLTFVPT